MPKSSLYLLGLLLVVVVSLARACAGESRLGREDLHARERQRPAPGRDPFTKFSLDQGATWEQAFIVPKCGAPGPWDEAACLAWANPIPGTEWIAVEPRQVGPRDIAVSPQVQVLP